MSDEVKQYLSLLKFKPATIIPASKLDFDRVQADIITAYARGDRRLLMKTTRQYGKSTTAALLALYQALIFPKSTILIFSIGLEEAKEVLFRLKELLSSMPIIFPTLGDSKTELHLYNGSRIKCRSANVSAGRGWTADLLIFDEAEYMPQEVFEGAQATLATRPDAGVLVISTVMSNTSWFYKLSQGDTYKVFTATADDCSRISQKFLAEQRKVLRPEIFRAEYFCEPLTGDARLFPSHLWQTKTVKDEYVRLVRGWDFAATADAGDYTCGALLGETADGSYHILDMVRGQWSSGDVENKILETTQSDGVGVDVVIPQDPGAAGKAWANSFVKKLAGYNVHLLRPDNKIRQAMPFSAQVQNKNVWLIDGGWVTEFISEATQFPDGQHDDQIDSICYAFRHMVEKMVGNTISGASLW